MTNEIKRTNNHTVHFMVNEEEMEELNRRFNRSGYKTKREFYLDSIMKNRIISIDVSGEFAKELRELQSLVSRNAANINQIAKHTNMSGSIEKIMLENIQDVLQKEIQMLFEFRSMVSNNLISEIVG
ncbi:MAG: mobilization protein [Synergistaceae bacterium]|nr:mobilization protein [Synergistaceae bacterium]